jgi:hypothetical protein
MQENARYMGVDRQTNSVVRLKRAADRWYVTIDDQVFQSLVAMAQAQRMLNDAPAGSVSVDLRTMPPDQQQAAFSKVMKTMMSDRFVKYELVVGKNKTLAAECLDIATVFNLHYRMQMVETPSIKSDAI